MKYFEAEYNTMTNLFRTADKHYFDDWLCDHWIKIFLIASGLWTALPFLAPILMNAGWTQPANALYSFYSLFCHQLPERSFFLFGQKTMYSLTEILFAWQNNIDSHILRKFVGTSEMGWKVAWSDRMIYFYGSIWFFGLLWWPLRQRVKQAPWWGFLLLLLPMVVDSMSHAISDIAGIWQGFRDTNMWLVALTDNAFPITFYAGDALGSFNSWMRFITGILAAFGVVWFAFPFINDALALPKRIRELKRNIQVNDKIMPTNFRVEKRKER